MLCDRGTSPWVRFVVVSMSVWLGSVGWAAGEDQTQPARADEFLAFVRAQVEAIRQKEKPPTTLAEWDAERHRIRQGLLDAWGGFPDEPCPLDPRVLGVIEREGYRIEKVVFQTRPGVRMTANLYRPDRPGKHPGLLMVHGHWRGAKQDPVVQSRCLGAVKLGFVVLAVDAFGAGERGIQKELGEYHGEMTGATLLPVGMPLSGLQVYENTRAIDYLRSRPEVDPERLGITGASGGGNQSMYAGAWDTRIGAVVPVCSVGTYHSYLGAACCICELVPGAIRLTEEAGVLGQVAPRSLMIVNATQDAVQFSVAEARQTVRRLEPLFALHGHADRLKHAVFESKHDYNQPMREAMYGWMSRALGLRPDATPIPEPALTTEDPETLRCYPGTTRPDDFRTVPRFAAREAEKLLAARRIPETADALRADAEARRRRLLDRVFGGEPTATPIEAVRVVNGQTVVRFQPEPGLHLEARVERGGSSSNRLAILVDLDGHDRSPGGRSLAQAVRSRGWTLVTLDLRATGRNAWPSDKIGKAPDHNTAEWAVWIGRPLLGQWVVDLRRLLDALDKVGGGLPRDVALIGRGPGGIVALATAAVDPRVTRVATVGSLSSYVARTPYVGQRLGVMAPGILREVGDVQHLAMLVAPRPVVIAGGVDAGGAVLDQPALARTYADAQRAGAQLGTRYLHLLDATADAAVLDALSDAR
ncbi:MAG: acetylxylan esterase [Isosphaeraceae bacterium]